jgi:hypothetical protein
MDKNTTSEGQDFNNTDQTQNVVLIVSLAVGFSLLGIVIFIVAMIYLKKNKGMKKTQELKRLRSIFKKAYVKNDSNLSKFSLKITSNLQSNNNRKLEEEDKSNVLDLNDNNINNSDNNQIDFSYNKIVNIIRPKRSDSYLKSSNNITSFSNSPLNKKSLFQKEPNQISIAKLGTKSDILEEKKVLHHNGKLKNEKIIRTLKR